MILFRGKARVNFEASKIEIEMKKEGEIEMKKEEGIFMLSDVEVNEMGE